MVNPCKPLFWSSMLTVWPSDSSAGRSRSTDEPRSSTVVAPVIAPKLPSAIARRRSSRQSSTPTRALVTYWMMFAPPGEPIAITRPAVAVEDDGRRHGAARSLARLDPVGHRSPLRIDRRKGEIGELVVEQKAAHHLLRAERGFDRARHRDQVARIVDDRHVGRGRQIERIVRPANPRRTRRLTRPTAHPSNVPDRSTCARLAR